MVTEENMETTITLSPKHGPIVNGDMNNVAHNDASRLDETHDELALMVMELIFQNDYLKAQIGGDGPKTFRVEEASREDDKGKVHGLYEKVKTLEKEIQEQKETQKASDDALEHLRVVYSEADQKVQELSVKIVEAQHKTEQEIKERDDKYVELDTKFGRLYKRAKQRIQDLQKEKDDIEVHLHDVNMKAEQASTQQTLAQQDLERVRQHANEALRLMDVERQQLKTTNNKLRDDIDELRHSLEAKANVLEGLEQTIFEKDRMLEETRRTLQNAEEKRQTMITELSSKYEKQLESFGAELADATSERSKAAETVSFLQIMLREKDTKIIELGAASTNEAARLRAALEEARAELGQQKVKHENERQSWEAACEALRIKLEASESTSLRSQIETAKLRSQLELELSKQNQLLNARDTELLAAKDEIGRVEGEFSAYKTRAHALLQKKDAEIVAAKDSEFLRAQEGKVKEAEREVLMALTERDKAIQDLQDMLSNHENEITARELALKETEQRIQSITMKLESATTLHLSEKDAWQKNLDSVEENWRLKYGMLEAQNRVHTGRDLQKDMEVLKLRYEKLKEEHDAFRDITDRMIEEKEKEINKFIEENKNLHRSLELRPSVC